ncbi:MAG: TetR/AcrR family transcriptional regulator [Chitinophagaceae bacterium]|nr:MAG: TetR/AcrR family transcriptional regulator [Chitinophagaceae bacterium]
MPPLKHSIREKGDIRARILATAWQMVKDDGWASLSIRKIAEAVDYSVPVIYDHFENKEAIMFEFARQGFQLLSKNIEKSIEKTLDPADQIRAIATAYWKFAAKHKEYYQLMYGMGMAGCEIEKCFPERADFRGMVMEPIKALMAKGKNPDDNPFMKYFTLWSILHGLVSIRSLDGNVSEDVNTMVMDDAVNGFIKNLG